jgi:hypothetical protein
MKRIWLAVAALALASVALFYAVLMVASLVSGRWLAGVIAAVASYAPGGGAYLLLGRYRKVTSKGRGGTHGDRSLRPLAAQPAGAPGLQALRGAAASGCPFPGSAATVRAVVPGPRLRSHPAAPPEGVTAVEKLTMVAPAPGEAPVLGWPDESWQEYAEHSVEHDDVLAPLGTA